MRTVTRNRMDWTNLVFNLVGYPDVKSRIMLKTKLSHWHVYHYVADNWKFTKNNVTILTPYILQKYPPSKENFYIWSSKIDIHTKV